jgi:hypothetical protein
VVARVPFRIAGPQRLITNSEVTTMTYGMIESVGKCFVLLANTLSGKVVYKDTRPQSSRLERRREEFYRARVHHHGTRPWGSVT